jgi:8-oxo-dGTP pyrophosphatase MutT (NUDIX family)
MSWFTLRRKAARVVLLDGDGRVLLLSASDPVDPGKRPWWEIPGGGMDPDESSEDAARRELYEETGITDVEIGPCVWTQHVEFDFGGYHFDQDERIHVAWGTADAWRPAALEALEAVAFRGIEWWTLEQVVTSDEPLVPVRMREYLPALVANDLPQSPIDIGP